MHAISRLSMNNTTPTSRMPAGAAVSVTRNLSGQRGASRAGHQSQDIGGHSDGRSIGGKSSVGLSAATD